MFDKPVHVMRPERYKEVWLMSKDRLSIPMMRTLHRCPVHLVPAIWHLQFLEKRIAEVEEHGLRYGYERRANNSAQPDIQPQGFRVAMFEPNISVVKTSSIPMLVCEEAYRADRSSVSAMHVLNSMHMKDHSTPMYMDLLDLLQDSKATFHGRNDIAGFMAQYPDAVVSHQWGNDQNYLYMDVLYGGYPLIHNSPWLKDAGYYYPNFDAQEGGCQLLQAFREHDNALDEYRARAQRVMDAVNSFNQANLNAFADRLINLCHGSKLKVGL